MLDYSQLADVTMERCDILGRISQHPDYIDRRYLTKEHLLANKQVHAWMKDAGMQTWQDQAGNCWGRYAADDPNAKSVILGSHLDTVPDGGRYDGMLGVIAPLSLIHGYHALGIKLPFHLDVVGFGDEEGTRFGSTLLGSRALTGGWPQSWSELHDAEGFSLPLALNNFGLDFDSISQAKLDNASILAFLELHIEQGPVLERRNLPVGVVNAIAGAKRIEYTLEGMAGHAGTVPMAMRHDAMCAASEMILAIEQIAHQCGLVATVGKIENRPNGVNVIPGKTVFTLDIRSESDEQRDWALQKIETELDAIVHKRMIRMSQREVHNVNAVHCDSKLQNLLSKAIEKAGIQPITLTSGAGHDAMEMAKLCPMVMLFMRCFRGISHHPDEAVEADDVTMSLLTLDNMINSLVGEYY